MPSAVDLARFRRRQLLRIVLRDVLGVATLSDVTSELSNLADAMLDVAYRRIREEFVARHGEPRLADGAAVRLLGDLAGQAGRPGAELQLGYRPDVRLRRQRRNRWPGAHQQQGVLQEGRQPVHRAAFHLHRRRPMLPRGPAAAAGRHAWARSASPRRAPRAYYRERARDWEKQMLIKARVSAGEPEPGAGAAGFRRAADLPELARFPRGGRRSPKRASGSAKKWPARAARRRSGLDIKLTPGGIRDIEFLVQCLQRLHGGREPWVRHGGTMLALFRLRDKGLLSAGEYARLATAYQFLRLPGAPAAIRRRPADAHAAGGSGRSGSAGAQDAARRQRAGAPRRETLERTCRNTWRPCGRSTSG